MKNVAARAGVSLGTVSNVLNRPAQVSERTRNRVLAAIAELGFVRNESARQLRGGGSRTLAYVVLDTSNPFFTDVAAGAQEAADSAGLMVFLCNSGEDPGRQAAFLDLLEQQRVEGVLITPADAADERLSLLPLRGTPTVLVDRGADDGHCSVTVDDVLGGDLAATHLLDSGHHRIAYIGGPTTLKQVTDRLAGVHRALDRNKVDHENVVVLKTASLTVAEGRRAGARLAGLPSGRRPTAAFCANDLLALGLLQEAVRLGMRVPDDLAIIGYDDIEFAAAAAVPLTSVAQPRHELGRAAAQLLIDEARNAPGHQHQQLVLAPELVVRASTRLRPVDGVA
jgi:LacI family transcriptional regulator